MRAAGSSCRSLLSADLQRAADAVGVVGVALALEAQRVGAALEVRLGRAADAALCSSLCRRGARGLARAERADRTQQDDDDELHDLALLAGVDGEDPGGDALTSPVRPACALRAPSRPAAPRVLTALQAYRRPWFR